MTGSTRTATPDSTALKSGQKLHGTQTRGKGTVPGLSAPVCKYHSHGKCRNGDACKYSHAASPDKQSQDSQRPRGTRGGEASGSRDASAAAQPELAPFAVKSPARPINPRPGTSQDRTVEAAPANTDGFSPALQRLYAAI